MATLLLDAPPEDRIPAPVGMATLVLVLSPVRTADGHLRVQRLDVEAGQTIPDALPPRQRWAHLVWNGGVVTTTADQVMLQPGDEVWAWPQWGDPFSAPLLITFAVGLAISIATTALSYLLFPPQKQQIDRPEEHTFSFGGIQTAVGPGNVVPVIYGRHRVGGQLLSAGVDQFLNVIGSPGGTTQVRAVTEPPTLRLLLALGEGPIDAILTDTIEINGQPIGNFFTASVPNQVHTRLGLPDQTPIFGFDETRNTLADGRDLPYSDGSMGVFLTYTTTQGVDAFILNVVFNQGLFHLNGKGEKEDNTVNVAYQLRKQGDPVFTPWSVFQVAAQRTAPVRFGIRHEHLDVGVYDIHVNFGGIRHEDDLRGKWTPTLESVTEIQQGTQSYPNTTVLGILALPSEALQGALPNVTVEVRGRQVRQNTFNPAYAWTDNPAWCVMDFLTSQRYGLGIPDSDIDLAAFSQWANYCNEVIDGEVRHTFNYVLDRDMRAQALLMEMCGGSRTILLKSQGLWTPRPTRNDPPVQLLSWSTCSNLKLSYLRDPDRINVMEGRFSNEEDGFGQDVMTWPTADLWPPEMRKASLELRGVTKLSRVQRALQFELNRRRCENMRLEMQCSIDAIVLQVHDIFRFSHPLPGWGVSGRVQEGSTDVTLLVDKDVTMQPGVSYQVYVKHTTDFTEVRPILNTGGPTRLLHLAVPLSGIPIPRDSTYAVGTASPEGAVKLFRVTSLRRNSDTTVQIEAVIHNPSITDEPEAVPLPVTTTLFNPLGPPPPLTFLLATELTRVQPSGASLRVVNLAWDIAPLGPGYAPYAGATVLRRTVLLSGQAGSATAGAVDLGAAQADQNTNFIQLTQLRGHVLEMDDFTVSTGGTYVYRVVPVSQRGIPNEGGALEALIHVAGPTTPDYYPGSVLNLRLRGKAVGDPIWEGRDVHVQWDGPTPSPLFSETFFVQDYLVQIWAPGQEYLMRSTYTAALEYTYTLEHNIEDQIRTGHTSARRDMEVWVWARTNTGRLSLDPSHIAITNPPPDMSMILPEVTAMYQAAKIEWDQWVEPRDFDHYELHLDVMTPPLAIYQDIGIAFHGVGSSFRWVVAQPLVIGQLYYTFVLPYDTFGPGLASQINSVTPFGLDPSSIDVTPPGPPTGLFLATGSTVNPDGTIVPWVEAHWTRSPDADVGAYQVHVRLGDSLVPTVYPADAATTSVRFDVPGGLAVHVKVLAADRFMNVSPFTDEVTITPGTDTVPPGPDAGLLAISDTKSIHLLWTPPPDPDYARSQVWAAPVNDFAQAAVVGSGSYDFTPARNHTGGPLGPAQGQFYWVQSVDTSGNVGPVHPSSPTGGVSSATALLVDQFIGSLGANKIIAGIIQAFVSLGVGPDGQPHIFLDGVNSLLYITDQTGNLRLTLGRLGPSSTHWGMQVFAVGGALMWNLFAGAMTDGVADAAITGPKIITGAIEARHLRTDEAVITGTAQIDTLVVTDAKIQNMVADKLLSGVLGVLYYVGIGGQLFIDGPNANIVVADQQPGVRVILGKLGPLVTDYGLRIYNRFGQLMWDLNGGAQTPGIGIAQVITQHVTANAISGSVVVAGGGGPVSGTSTAYATVTLDLEAGDQVWLIGSCNAISPGGGGLGTNMTLREDSATGTPYHTIVASAGGLDFSSVRIPMMTQHVYLSPSAQAGKNFVLAFIGGTGSVENVRLGALRLRK